MNSTSKKPSSCHFSFLQEPVSYSHFFHEYLLNNKCCVLGKWVTSKWKSREEWINHEGSPDLDVLEKHFGGAMVPVADCTEEKFSAHPKCDMQMREYISYMRNCITPCNLTSQSYLYLKDWHFTKDFPNYEAYATPPFFQSDWMNEYWDTKSDEADDYRFVYIGPKGSWTPFHADVFRSFSWSANICGRKKWIIFPPGEEENLKDNYGQLAFDLLSDDLKDPKKFPRVHNVKTRLEIIQEAGEVIFVPSGWHHQVFNIEDTISINHNWLNGTNVMICWKYIKNCLDEVKKEISDCREMEGWNLQCQMVLKASSGIDYQEFYRFMHKIAEKRLLVLENLIEVSHDHSVATSFDGNDGAIVVNKQPSICSETSPANKRGENCDIAKSKTTEKESTPSTDIPFSPGIELSVLHEALKDCEIKCHFELSQLSHKWEKDDMGPKENICNHYLFDLIQIHKIITNMIQDKDFMELNLDSLPQCPKLFQQRLTDVVY